MEERYTSARVDEIDQYPIEPFGLLDGKTVPAVLEEFELGVRVEFGDVFH